jgi:hypothetical protein
MRDVIPEVVGKFIECGDLDFHPHLHALVGRPALRSPEG